MTEQPPTGTPDYQRSPELLSQVNRNIWERLFRSYPVEMLDGKNGSARRGGTVMLVGLLLATFANPDGTSIWPGVARLAEKSGLGEQATRNALRDLRRTGFIWRTQRGSSLGTKNSSDHYVLTAPRSLLSTATGTGVPVVGQRHRYAGTDTTGCPVPPTTTETTTSPPQPPAPVAADTADLSPPRRLEEEWTGRGIGKEQQQRMWRKLRDDPNTQHPVARGMQPGWIAAVQLELAEEDRKHLRDRVELARASASDCEHGVPGGTAVHPTSEVPLCPLCRHKVEARTSGF